jgi:hypothetical protein
MYANFKAMMPISEPINLQETKESLLFIEYNNDTLYLYDKKNNNFICQGKTLEELAFLSKRHNNINDAVVLDAKSNSILVFSNGKVV